MAAIERTIAQIMTAAYAVKTGQKGQGMAEYGLILALVAVVVITALTAIGTGLTGTFNSVSAKL